jgi:ferredoxin
MKEVQSPREDSRDYVHGLPYCIGCGSCVNICPTGALQIEDRGEERLVLMNGTIINRVKLERCEKCGAYYAPKVFLKHVDTLIGEAGAAYHRALCPTCARTVGAASIVGVEPDVSLRRDAGLESTYRAEDV